MYTYKGYEMFDSKHKFLFMCITHCLLSALSCWVLCCSLQLYL